MATGPQPQPPDRTETPLLERAIAVLAPSWAAQRGVARIRANQVWAAERSVRNYEAAAHTRRTQGWRATSGSAVAVMANGLDTLRDRSRQLCRDNPWASKALGVIEDDVVGSGFTCTFKHPTDDGVAEEAQRLWDAHAEDLGLDPEGLHDFSGMLGLATRGMAEGGDMLLRRRWRRPEDGLAVPMQVQLVEGDHLDTMKDEQGNAGARIVQGVEFDALGRRVAYWVHKNHPGDPWQYSRDSVRVAASEVLHLFRVDRKGAVRGVSWAAPCLLRLRDIDLWEDARLLRAQLSNMFVGTVSMPNEVASFVNLDADGRPKQEKIEEYKPGQIQYLSPGEVLSWNDPPEPSADHAEYLRVGLLAVAAGFQIPYEALTGDLRNTSFSSGRLGWLQWQRRIEAYRWRILVPRVCKPVARWFLEALAVKDERFLACTTTWDPPHREMIDPTAEVAAFERAVRAGFRSRAEVVRSLGGNPAQVLAEAAADGDLQHSLGVMFTTDPSHDLGRKPAGEPGRKPGQAANPAAK